MIHSKATRKCQPLFFLPLGTLLLLVACATVEAPGPSPFPHTIQIITPTHPSDALECLVALCCFHCTFFPVQRVIDGGTFVSGRNLVGSESRVRLYGVDTPERDEPYGCALFYVYTEAGGVCDGEVDTREAG